jgi:phosphoribosyl 1,2-cyclic phosphate phosphodiesterase
MSLKVTVLGSGTSTGVPVIACGCAVCRDPGINRRLRASILIEAGGETIVVDTGPDFRAQMLAAQVRRLDRVLYTHLHADHTHGFDDVRAFHFERQVPVVLHLAEEHVADFKARFAYVFQDDGYIVTKPTVDLVPFRAGTFQAGPLEVEAVRLPHGTMTSYAFKIGGFVYATDFKAMPEAVIQRWKGTIDTMIASGVHYRPHPAHSNVPETVALLGRLGVRRGFITHMNHEVDARIDQARLPPGIAFAQDGLELTVD